MSRPPSQQMNSQQQQKQQARMSTQSDRSINSSKNPYLNPNFLPSPHLQQQQQPKSGQQSQPGSSQNAREMRQQTDFNQLMHQMEMMPQNPQQQAAPSKKPSLLSGYHNPTFSPNDRNDMMTMNQLARFYVPPQPQFMGGLGTNNPRRSPSQATDNEKTGRKSNPPQQSPNQRPNSNQQQQFPGPNQPPPMHSPSQIQQQMLQSGFSPAAIAAAQAALNSTNPTNFSQLIQQQLHLQHLQHLQSQFQQQPNPLSDNNNSSKKQEVNAPPNVSPRTTPSQSAPVPVSVPTPPSASTSINTSSCYVPEVEAISPTPEDQKENSSLQAIKDKIIQEICKVEKDIASTQYQFDMLEKKQKEIKELHARPLVDENGDKCIKLTTTLAEKIYKENRKKAEESHKEVLKSNSALTNVNTATTETSFDEDIPIYHEFSDTKVSQDIRKDFETVMKQRLVKYFKRQQQLKKQREKYMIEEYDSLHAEWQKKVDKVENNFRKKQKDAKCREFYEKVFPELRKSREERERAIQKVKTAIADKLAKEKAAQEAAANPEAAKEAAELAAAAAKETEGNDEVTAESTQPEPDQPIPPDPVEEERKRIYQLSVVTPLCIEERLKRYSFVNNNGFVKDPVALFKAAKNQTFWNEKEKEIFLDKLLLFGKNFEIIARFLDKKETQDCIEYYYLTKKKINYKMLIRKQARKRKNQKQNVAALLAGNGATPTFSGNTNNSNIPGTTPTNSTNYNSQTPSNQLVNMNAANETCKSKI